jgi:acyl carrier protein
MTHLVPESEIDLEVRRAIAKALRKDEGAVTMDASVIEDLGGTSLDFLDITFRLEQAFGVKLPHNLLVDQIEELFGEGTAVDGSGQLTASAKEVVRLRLGEHDKLAGELFADEVPALVTPRALALGVKEILATLPRACGCGASAWKRGEGVKVVCGACGKAPAFTDGDTLTQQWLRTAAAEKNLFAVA